MDLTTLCYIEKDEKYLMLHRVSKKNDINRDKWIGIGGHFEKGESPEDCIRREALEETGLMLTSFALRGIVTFIDDEYTEYMFLFTADGFEGKEIPCDEGELLWIPKSEVSKLNLWQGDKIFLDLLCSGAGFFSLKLVYSKGQLTEAYRDGKKIR